MDDYYLHSLVGGSSLDIELYPQSILSIKIANDLFFGKKIKWYFNQNENIRFNMKKNVAGQVVGCQMIRTSDLSNFIGTVTAYITGDSGTQTIGSVGTGICSHEGNGYYSYNLAQEETNFDHVAITFTASGAITQTIQFYTSFPQTGDSFVRIGATGSGLTSLATASTALSSSTWTSELATNIATTNSTVANNIDTLVSSRMALPIQQFKNKRRYEKH